MTNLLKHRPIINIIMWILLIIYILSNIEGQSYTSLSVAIIMSKIKHCVINLIIRHHVLIIDLKFVIMSLKCDP